MILCFFCFSSSYLSICPSIFLSINFIVAGFRLLHKSTLVFSAISFAHRCRLRVSHRPPPRHLWDVGWEDEPGINAEILLALQELLLLHICSLAISAPLLPRCSSCVGECRCFLYLRNRPGGHVIPAEVGPWSHGVDCSHVGGVTRGSSR